VRKPFASARANQLATLVRRSSSYASAIFGSLRKAHRESIIGGGEIDRWMGGCPFGRELHGAMIERMRADGHRTGDPLSDRSRIESPCGTLTTS
jgi:hypothetical protein